MYSVTERIGASRTDKNGRLKLPSALDLIQDCSMHWRESEPSFQDYMTRNGMVMVLASRQVDIVRLPIYGERVTVRTSVYDCRSFIGHRNTVIYGEDGSPCVLTWSIGAFVESDSGKIARLWPEELEKLTLDDKVPMEYLDKKIVLPDEPGSRMNAVAVRRHDIDLNRHMNNARYVEVALELLPDGFEVKRLRIEYKAQAKPGDLLYPRVFAVQDAKRYVVLSDGSDRPYAVMEFS